MLLYFPSMIFGEKERNKNTNIFYGYFHSWAIIIQKIIFESFA
jgi:hypothetical protein